MQRAQANQILQQTPVRSERWIVSDEEILAVHLQPDQMATRGQHVRRHETASKCETADQRSTFLDTRHQLALFRAVIGGNVAVDVRNSGGEPRATSSKDALSVPTIQVGNHETAMLKVDAQLCVEQSLSAHLRMSSMPAGNGECGMVANSK
jgi:hypothetical protein